MARIPLGDFGNVVARPAPQAQVPDGAFDRTSGLRQLANTGMSVALQAREEIQRNVTETQAKEADTELQRRITALMFDPDNGYYAKNGKNAVDAYQSTVDEANAIRSEIGGKIKDQNAKRAFDLASPTRINAAVEGLSRHAMQQKQAWEITTSKNRAAQTIDSAATAYADDALFSSAIAVARNEAIAQGKLLGQDEATVAQTAKAYQDHAWDKRFASARLADPVYALSLFLRNKDALDPAKRDTMAVQLFSAAAPLLASEIVAKGEVRTTAPTKEQALAIAMAGEDSGLKISVSEGQPKEGASVFDGLPADMKLRIVAMAKQQLGQSRALQVHQLQGLLKDAEAAALDGKTTVIPLENFAMLGPLGAEAAQTYRNSQVMATNIAQAQSMTVAERMALANSVVPTQSGQGYAEAAKRADQVARAVSAVNSAQAADPVAFTIQSSPTTVKPAFEALQSAIMDITADPARRKAAAQAFAAATVAEQQRLGEPPSQTRNLGAPLPVLPKDMATLLARQFVTQPDGGQNPAVLLQAQADMWGRYWPQVYAQIAKDIGPTARIIANIKDTPAASVLAMHANVKTEDLKKAIATEDVKSADTDIDKKLVMARNSLAGWTTAGTRTFNDIDEAAKRLSYIYVSQGTKPSDAATRAVKEVFDDFYDMRGMVRIPKLKEINPAAVERGMMAVLRGAESISLRVPPDEAAILGEKYTAKQLAASLTHAGFFVTLGDDSGVSLWMRGRNGERAVENSDGKPITYTWAQLQEAARASEKQTVLPKFGETGGGAASGLAAPRKPQAKDSK